MEKKMELTPEEIEFLEMMEKKQKEYSKDQNAKFEDYYTIEEVQKWRKIGHKRMAIIEKEFGL